MTMLRRTVLAAAVILTVGSLAACKKDTVVAKNESVESVAKKVAASDHAIRSKMQELLAIAGDQVMAEKK